MNVINAYFIYVCVCVCVQIACDTGAHEWQKCRTNKEQVQQFKGDSLNVIKFVHKFSGNLWPLKLMYVCACVQADVMQSQ